MASNLQLRIAHLEPQTLALWVLSPHSNREFCVLGIVVHLRLGNCIGYSLREHEWHFLLVWPSTKGSSTGMV